MITETMYIGSGDVTALMSGLHTETHAKLLQRFVSGVKPYYNALASPIDACRAGAIMELRYLQILPECYFSQVVSVCKSMDVFKASLDFAKIDKGDIVDFDELKSISFDDFMEINSITDEDERIKYIKKKYKHYYYQVQEQLMCTDLNSCNLVFLAVFSYDDEENYQRNIKENEYLKTRIKRDENVISEIRERGIIFQNIKDTYKTI